PKPAFTAVGNMSIATARFASSCAEPTLWKNSPSVACTSASISGPDAALHGGAAQGVTIAPTRRARQPARILDPTRIPILLRANHSAAPNDRPPLNGPSGML